MIKLRLGLMKLLENKLFNLPSEHVPAVIGEVLKAEYMLVWAYHDSDDVREFAIRVIVTPYTLEVEGAFMWKLWKGKNYRIVLLSSFNLNGFTNSFTYSIVTTTLNRLLERTAQLYFMISFADSHLELPCTI